MVTLASAPRPEMPNKIFFKSDSSVFYKVVCLYNVDRIYRLFVDLELGFFSPSDALHIIVVHHARQPLSLKLLAMAKVLKSDLDVKELPRELQVRAEKDKSLA